MTAGAPAVRLRLTPLDASHYRDTVQRALAEDLAGGDITTDATTSRHLRGRGEFHVKQPCVLAGLDVAFEVFRQLDADVGVAARYRADGDTCEPGDVIAVLEGRAASLLGGERTALNFLQRLSGIATRARAYVDAAAGSTIILDTRKTTPTLRALEKYAVRAGGAANHRFGLGDGILIKDNHIRVSGSITEAIRRARRVSASPADARSSGCSSLDLRTSASASGPLANRIEVEAQSLAGVDEALDAGADIVLLDNLTLAETADAIDRCRGRAETEISGGITLDRIPELAALGPTYISAGALTHSAPAVDLSFEMVPLP